MNDQINKEHFIADLPNIILKEDNQYYLRLKEEIPLNIYGKPIKIQDIPTTIYTRDAITQLKIGGIDIYAELCTDIGTAKVWIEYEKGITLGIKEKERIVQFIEATILKKDDLIPDFTKREIFFEPDNLPPLKYSEMILRNDEDSQKE